MRLKARYGYWETDNYPIGGCFRRAGDAGKNIKEIIRKLDPKVLGCNAEVLFADGTRGALKLEYTEES